MRLCLCRVVAQGFLVGDLYLVALSALVVVCGAPYPMVGLAQLQECEPVFFCKIGPVDCRSTCHNFAFNGNGRVEVAAA